MAYNLIDEQWIPVERRSGKIEMIAPAQIVDREDPPIRVASPRPDFDGALLEFLVGLLQTAAAPETERAWEREFETPPAVSKLERRLASVRDAFNLDGDGPRFMQDLTVGDDPAASREPIGALLIDRIGERGLSEGPSLFAKPGAFAAMSLPAAAAALMTLQTYAPAGGRGQLTSLRGGGPLTTLVLGDDLWQTAWLNVLPRREFEARVPGNPGNDAPDATFPWMTATRSSAGRGGATTPQKVHPLQHLWGLPRRFRLVTAPELRGTCSVSGAADVRIVREYLSRPQGTDYDGDFRHPWTPYTFTANGQPWNPKKGSADGLPYRDWPLLVTGGEKRAPAAVISYFTAHRRDAVAQPRLIAFGFAMDKMKPLRWCRAEAPLVTASAAVAGDFAAAVQSLVDVSEEVRGTLVYQVKSAWTDRPGDLDAVGRVNPAFWSETEPAFFDAVRAMRDALEQGTTSQRDAAREAWLEALHRAAVALFDRFADISPTLAPPALARAVLARRDLVRFTSPSNQKLRKLAGLVALEEPARSRGTRTPRARKERTA